MIIMSETIGGRSKIHRIHRIHAHFRPNKHSLKTFYLRWANEKHVANSPYNRFNTEKKIFKGFVVVIVIFFVIQGRLGELSLGKETVASEAQTIISWNL